MFEAKDYTFVVLGVDQLYQTGMGLATVGQIMTIYGNSVSCVAHWAAYCHGVTRIRINGEELDCR